MNHTVRYTWVSTRTISWASAKGKSLPYTHPYKYKHVRFSLSFCLSPLSRSVPCPPTTDQLFPVKGCRIISQSAWGDCLRFPKSKNNVVSQEEENIILHPPLPAQPPDTPLPGGRQKPDCPKQTTPLRWQHFHFAIWFFFSLICVLCAFPFVKRAQAFHFAFYLSCCRYSENVLAFQLVITHHHIPNL